MTLLLTPEWGPYTDALDARLHLCRFIDRVCGPEAGVAWAANGSLYALRAPRRDSLGFGDAVVFQWNPAPPPPAPRPTDFWGRVKSFIADALADYGRAQIAEGQSNLAMGSTLGRGIASLMSKHGDDAAGVALDIICVAFSLALVGTGVGALGIAALAGSTVLLVIDGSIYGVEMSGNEERAAIVRQRTETIRVLATIATLPDLAWGGAKAIREFQEVRQMRAADNVTATSAEALATRAANAVRAARYADIAEKARLRSPIRAEQITAAVLHEFVPRIAGAGSTMLLFREEIQEDKSLLHAIMERLQMHCTAVHT